MRRVLVLCILVLALIPVASCELLPRDFEWETAKGNVPGHEWAGISAHSENVDATEDVIWCLDRAYIFPAVATLMNVSSSDVDDVDGGNGLWNVTVNGLDENRTAISEVVQLNGQTPVSTVNEFLRVNSLHGVDAGTTGTNEGYVFIGVGAVVAGEPNTVYHVICESEGWSHVGVFSLKAGYTAFLVRGIFGTDDAKQVTFGVFQRGTIYPDRAWKMTIHFHVEQQYIYPAQFYQELPLECDLLIKSSVTVGDASVTSKMSLLLIETSIINNSTLAWDDGSPSEVAINDPVDINIVESIDLMASGFTIFTVFAALLTYVGSLSKVPGDRMMRFAVGFIFWIASLSQWIADGGNIVGLIALIAPTLMSLVWTLQAMGETTDHPMKKDVYSVYGDM